MKENNRKNIYIEYKPEDYIGDVAITLHIKKSQHEKYLGLVNNILNVTEYNIKSLNTAIEIDKG